jgi:hypothetical protein
MVIKLLGLARSGCRAFEAKMATPKAASLRAAAGFADRAGGGESISFEAWDHVKPGQKRREPRCEIDTWGTHFASLSAPIVAKFA